MTTTSGRMAVAALIALGLTAPGRADDGPAHQVRQERPVALGTSGGSTEDRSARFCCSGTLGALVSRPDGLAILSNNHVLAGPVNDAPGAPISQPGSVDVACQVSPDDVVADLAVVVPIDFTATNRVDAAAATVRPGQVKEDGSILDVGQPSSTTLPARFGLRVRKSGRTTGLTHGTVLGTNASITVRYPAECGRVLGGSAATFEHQILILARGLFPPFSKGGDSGSLVVEDVDACPRPVGLLFAGSPLVTFANPIDEVLTALDATVVGCSATPGGARAVEPSLPGEAAAVAARTNNHARLRKLAGVVGTGVGRASAANRAVVQVYVERASRALRRAIPSRVDGVPTEIVTVGRVVALGCGG